MTYQSTNKVSSFWRAVSLQIGLKVKPTLGVTMLCLIVIASQAFDLRAQDYDLSTSVRVDSANLSLSKRTYYDGAETLGRVGREAILRRDVLHTIKKYAHIQTNMK